MFGWMLVSKESTQSFVAKKKRTKHDETFEQSLAAQVFTKQNVDTKINGIFVWNKTHFAKIIWEVLRTIKIRLQLTANALICGHQPCTSVFFFLSAKSRNKRHILRSKHSCHDLPSIQRISVSIFIVSENFFHLQSLQLLLRGWLPTCHLRIIFSPSHARFERKINAFFPKTIPFLLYYGAEIVILKGYVNPLKDKRDFNCSTFFLYF